MLSPLDFDSVSLPIRLSSSVPERVEFAGSFFPEAISFQVTSVVQWSTLSRAFVASNSVGNAVRILFRLPGKLNRSFVLSHVLRMFVAMHYIVQGKIVEGEKVSWWM